MMLDTEFYLFRPNLAVNDPESLNFVAAARPVLWLRTRSSRERPSAKRHAEVFEVFWKKFLVSLGRAYETQPEPGDSRGIVSGSKGHRLWSMTFIDEYMYFETAETLFLSRKSEGRGRAYGGGEINYYVFIPRAELSVVLPGPFLLELAEAEVWIRERLIGDEEVVWRIFSVEDAKAVFRKAFQIRLEALLTENPEHDLPSFEQADFDRYWDVLFFDKCQRFEDEVRNLSA